MKSIIEWLGQLIRERCLRKKFPDSVIHNGAMADAVSFLGKHTVLFKDAYLLGSTLGNYSYVQSGSVINNAEVGPYCSIAGGVVLGLAMHPTSMVSTSPVFYDNTQPLPRFFVKTQLFSVNMPRTIVEADVWIGQGVLVKAGVRIGVGAVVGAGAVVTKDIPPYMIAAGNPCRVIRSRFAAETCQKLLDSRWWELDEPTLQEMGQYFCEPDHLCERVMKVSALPKK